MTIHIDNGQEIIDILYDGFVTCLKVKKPIALDWYDQAGSVGRFYAFAQDCQPLAIHFNEVLATGGDEQVLHVITGFLQLFRSGQYTVYIDRNKRIEFEFELHTGIDPLAQANNQDYNYYNPDGQNLMFTQHISRINENRVREYEAMILAGGRPKAVLFRADFKDEGIYEDGSKWVSSYDSPFFILDGHHKLLAYKNLQIDAEYVLISRETVGQEEILAKGHRLYFDYEYFLSNSARQHIISHAPLLCVDNNPDSMHYNRQLDDYLRSARRIGSEILNLFREVWQRKDKAQLAWLQDRLGILEQQVNNHQKVQASYLAFHQQHNMLGWFAMEIETMQDYRLWIERLFESSFDEVMSTIRHS